MDDADAPPTKNSFINAGRATKTAPKHCTAGTYSLLKLMLEIYTTKTAKRKDNRVEISIKSCQYKLTVPFTCTQETVIFFFFLV